MRRHPIVNAVMTRRVTGAIVEPERNSSRGFAGGASERSAGFRRCAVGSLALWLCAAASASAQNFAVDWFTTDGGGGTSGGGGYSLSCTIGQPDAGPTMSGGSYSLIGGFWSIVAAVQAPGAPLLSITQSSTNTLVVCWPSPSTGFVLQENSSLYTSNWTNTAQTSADDGVHKRVIISPRAGNKFYRLHKP